MNIEKKLAQHNNAPRYNVMMQRKIGGWVMLTSNGRDAWTLKVAQRHMLDVASDPKFYAHYDEFKIVEA